MSITKRDKKFILVSIITSTIINFILYGSYHLYKSNKTDSRYLVIDENQKFIQFGKEYIGEEGIYVYGDRIKMIPLVENLNEKVYAKYTPKGLVWSISHNLKVQ